MASLMHQSNDIVIIGGGVWGCAIAYYYIRNNPGSSVLLLERNELNNAATSRAAALMTRIRSKKEFIPLSLETYRVIPELETLLGEKMLLQKNGVLHIAASDKTVQEQESLINIARDVNDPVELWSTAMLKARVPWLQTVGIRQAAFMPNEAYCDPYLLGSFFARAAIKLGAVLRQGITVERLVKTGDTITEVVTSEGAFTAKKIVLANGVWAPALAQTAELSLSMAPVRSQYWITEKLPIFPENSPTLILPDAQAYSRPEGGRLLFGIREKKSLSENPLKLPSRLEEYQFSPDQGAGDLHEVIDSLARFFPAIYDVGLQFYIAGFSGYTPDNFLSMGKVPGVKNLLAATGCVGAGISVCGGVGLAFAAMAADQPNPFDFSAFDLSRFGAIDPFSNHWLQRCAAARAHKTSG